MNANIEQLGMLKMLEHLYEMLHSGKRIKYDDIKNKNGIEFKFWSKLLRNNIIERTGTAKKPVYTWVGMRPNIYMAKKLMADDLYFDGVIMEKDAANEKMIQSIFYRIEYNESQAAFNFDNYSPTHNTPGWALLHSSLEPEKCVEFFNLCLEKYPVFNICTPQRDKLYHPPLHEIKDLFDEYLNSYKPKNKIIEANDEPLIRKKELNVEFDKFWDLYDKKEDRDKCEKKWNSLTNNEREEIMQKLPPYIQATPDKKFRKNPITYLNNKSWNNEIVAYIKDPIPQNKTTGKTISEYTDTELWEELKKRGCSGTITKSLA